MNADHVVPEQARLSAYARVATEDVDDAEEAIGRIFCPHDLKPARRQSAFYAQHNSAACGDLSVNYVAYGGTVAIDPGALETFFLVQIPLRGEALIRNGARSVATRAGQLASILSPSLPTQMVWADCAQLIVMIARKRVEQRAAALGGMSARTIEFMPGIDLSGASGIRLTLAVESLVATAERSGPRRGIARIAAANAIDTLLEVLLVGHEHSASRSVTAFQGNDAALPVKLRRTRDFLEAHADDAVDLDDLAREADVCLRTLQLGFRRHFGMTMSEMLRDIRLGRLNARLAAAENDVRISDVAFDLGFTHLGRMAGAYRAKFGETPAQTLHRAV